MAHNFRTPLRLAWLVLALGACTHEERRAPGGDAPSPAPESIAPPIDAATDDALDASRADDALDASRADAEPTSACLVANCDLRGKTVLHAGDSMVGGSAALTRALRERFMMAEVKSYSSDSWVSANLSLFRFQPRFWDLLKKRDPDVVLITLGANDAMTTAPENLAVHVQAIVAKIGARPCLWISPPPFAKHGVHNGAARYDRFVEMLEANVAPCRFFDTRGFDHEAARSAALEPGAPAADAGPGIPRILDRIHPTDAGGALWAAAVWREFFTQENERPDILRP